MCSISGQLNPPSNVVIGYHYHLFISEKGHCETSLATFTKHKVVIWTQQIKSLPNISKKRGSELY